MSKAKKIISMLLAVVMVVSVAPVSAMAAADANPTVAGVTYVTPEISTTSYTIDTTATTEVIRVAAAGGSFSYGEGTDTAPYTIVAATPSGIPENGGTYAHVAYAGETPEQPTVRFTIDGRTLAEDPVVKPSVVGISFGNTKKTTSGTKTTYEFPIQGSGVLLAPHTDVVFTITYKIGTVSYDAYAYSHIENILVMGGFINYHQVSSSKGNLRYSAVGQLQSANMYSRRNTQSSYDNTLQSDGTYKEVLVADKGGSSANGPFGYINYATTSAHTGGESLLGCGSEAELDGSVNAFGSQAPNGNIAGTELDVLYVYSQIKDGDYSNKGTGDDSRRSEPIVYMDYNDTLQSLNMRFTLQNAEASDFVNLTLNSVKFYAYANDPKPGSEAGDAGGTTLGTDQFSVSGYNYGNNGSNTISGSTYNNLKHGAYLMAKITGYGPKKSYMDAGTDVSQADISTGSPVVLWVDFGASGNSRTLYGLTSMNLVIRNYDTRDLQAMYNGMLAGTGSYTLKTPTLKASYGALGMTFNKGVTPRKSMYDMDTSAVNPYTGANYTGKEYDNFVTALKAAGSVLAQPDTSQPEIDQAALNLYNAYYALPTPYSTTSYKINHYLVGTTTPVVVNGQEVKAQTGSAPLGSVVNSKAATIVGHKATGTTVYSTDITGKEQSVEINYYYEPMNYNITYYYNNPNYKGSDMIGYAYNTKLDLDSISAGTRDFYDFLGWYDNNYDVNDSSFNAASKLNDGTSAIDFTVMEDKNFYALWKISPIKVSVTPITNVGTELTANKATLGSVQLISEDDVKGFANPGDYNIDGYFFGGYYYDYDASTKTFSNPVDWSTVEFKFGDSDLEVYARMIDVNGRVSFNSNGGTDVDDITFSAGDTVSPASVPTRKGYTFEGWWNETFTTQYFENGTEANGWTDGSEEMANNTGFLAYAKWRANEVTITFDMGSATTDFDTTTAQMPTIPGYVDSAIDPGDIPPVPTKFGKTFAQWVIKGTNTVFNFTKFPTEDIVLEPVWNNTKYSAFISIGAYEKLSGEYVEVVNPTGESREGAAQKGDVVTFRMTSQTNFYTGSSVFVFMYDKNFFELVDNGTDAFVLNSENEYVSGIDATAIGVTDDNLMDRVWPETANMDRSTYNAMMVTIDPTITTTNYNCEPMADGKWLVEFQLKVKDTATGSGTVYMHNDWTRTADNIMGTMFYGWAESNTASVAETYNNVVEPNLTKATATITIDATPQVETEVTINPNGGMWANGSTSAIEYRGNAGTEIMDYVAPTREGYTLTGWQNSSDASVVWAEGYYATEEQDGAEFVAQWEAEMFTVNYYVEEGGELWDEKELAYDSLLEGPFYDVEKTGYVFAGWVDADGNPYEVGVSTVPLGGVDLYGTWVPGEVDYKIVINYGDGSVNTKTKQAITGSKVYIAETAGTDPDATYVLWSELATVNGYEFDTENEANLALATTPTVINADGSTIINVYYKAKTIVFTFDANGGAYADGTTVQTISGEYRASTEEALATLKEPTREGYDFKGWNRNQTNASNGQTINVLTAFNGDMTYYAAWTAKKVNVTFDAGEGTFADGTNTSVSQLGMGSVITAPTAPTRTGYNFLGWSTDGSTVITDLGTIDKFEDKSFIAVWAIRNFEVTYMIDDVLDSTVTAEYNSSVTVAEYPEDIIGYSFDGWYYNGTKYAPGQTITMPAGELVLEGYFVEDTFAATFNANGGTFSDDTDVYTTDVVFGSAITAPSAPARNGYEFLGWAESADSNTTVIPGTMDTEGKTYYAVWKATIWEYKVEFYYMDTNGEYGAAAESETITAQGNVASTVAYQPAAKTGFTIDAESSTNYDAEANTVSGTVTVDPVLVLKVYYGRNQHTVTWIESLNGTAVKTETLYYGEAIVAPEYSVEGYTWTSTTPSVDAEMGDADLTYTMNITPNKYDVIFNAGEGQVDGAATKTISANYKATLESVYNNIATVTKEGYALTGWSYTEDGAAIDLATETVPVGGVTLYAVWEIQSYAVNFRAGNGTFVENGTNTYSTTVTYGEVIPAPSNPERTGYSFTGWNPSVPATMPAAQQNFVAQWALESYTVKFVIDTEVVEASYPFGEYIEVPDETMTVKDGYTFKYWMDADGNEVEIPETMGDIGDNGAEVVYTAYFEINSYSVTWNNEDGSVYEGPVSYEYNAAVAKPATDPSKTGYTFKGWKAADGTLYDAATAVPAMGTEDVVYTAYFEINKYTITFDTDGGSAVAAITQNYNTAVAAPAAPTKTGYTFAGWDNLPSTMPAENVTVKALWTINQYTITFDTDGGTAVDAITQDYNTAVTAPEAPAKTGYSFAGWTPAVPATMPAENVTVKAQWTINSYTATWISDGVTVETKAYEYGAAVIKPSNPVKEGHTFAGWLSNDGILYAVGQDVPAMGAADVTYTAKFDIDSYVVTWLNEDGSTYETASYEYGASVNKPAVAPEKVGYTFTGWKAADGTLYGDGQNVPAMGTNNVSYTAYFVINQYTIVFDAVDGKFADDKSTYTITANYDTLVSKPANPSLEGYTFQYWADAEGNKIDVPATWRVAAEDINYYAVWEVNVYTVTFVDAEGEEYFTVDLDYGTVIASPEAYEGYTADPALTHYTFEGWSLTEVALEQTKEEVAANVIDFATAEIKVPEGGITIYPVFARVNVTLKVMDDSTAIVTIDETVVDETVGYITGLETRLSKSKLLSTYLTVEGDGRLEVTLTKYNVCGTGAKVEVYDNLDDAKPVETYFIIIYGDVNGDSDIDATDASMLGSERAGLTSWSNTASEDYDYCKVIAADIVDDNPATPEKEGMIDGQDTNAIDAVTLLLATIDQQTGNVVYSA